MNIILTRQSLTSLYTLGTLTIGAQHVFTLEQPWNNNLQGHSCIPPGTYQLVPHSTDAHPDTWAMVNPDLDIYHEDTDVPAGRIGRFACLIHPANWAFELQGCIAPGLHSSDSPKGKMVTESRAAFARIQAALGIGSTGHTITISQPVPSTKPLV